jgi:HprK-related kinase A
VTSVALPLTVGNLPAEEFAERLSHRGLCVRLGPFDVKIRSDVAPLREPLHRLYASYPLLDDERVFAMHVVLKQVRSWSRIGQRSVRFIVDGRAPHEDLPRAHALPVLEWGINLVIALRWHSLLMLHSAAVERSGGVMLLPAAPGFGKTTLCTGLVHRGWRLFSDEFGLVRPGDAEVLPVPRPMPLKNQSIEVIRAFAPDAIFGPEIPNTRKGTIVHVAPPAASVAAAASTARVRWIVFPKWEADVGLHLQPLRKTEAFMMLASNAFNYEMLGEAAFDVVRQIVSEAQCYQLVYSDLEQAIQALNGLVEDDAARR